MDTQFHSALPDPSETRENENNSDAILTKSMAAPNDESMATSASNPKINNNDNNCIKSRPTYVDQFFKEQAKGDILSPIKSTAPVKLPGGGNEVAQSDDAYQQESLELKLDGTYGFDVRKDATKCVQPDGSEVESIDVLELNQMEFSEATSAKSNHTVDMSIGSERESFTRKRPQTAMEPAVFEEPRLPKHPHKECPPVPEFNEYQKPCMQFSTEDVFRPKVQLNGVSLEDLSIEPMSVQELSSHATFDIPHEKSMRQQVTAALKKSQSPILEESPAPEEPSAQIPETAPDETFDRTTRSSGSWSFFLGLLMAVDEALDPVVGSYVPSLLRYKGMNLALTSTPIVLYMAYSVVRAVF